MSSGGYPIKIAFCLAMLLGAAAWVMTPARVRAQSGESLSLQEEHGKQIYLKGEAEGGEIIAVLGGSDLELPASSFVCSNCHGLRGEGSKEGGLQPPAINWAALTRSQTSALTSRERTAYDEATVARAISAGLDPAGNMLHPGMPHYKMTATQMADLISYLKKIGGDADLDPGLSEDSIRVGAALPLSGPLSRVGEDVKAALEAYFAEVNAQGGIYGRKIELALEDSRGDPAGTSEATRTLVEKRGVFALVGSFEPAGSTVANEILRRDEVPLVGPLTLSPVLPPVPNRFVFYLLPSFKDQAGALVEFIGSDQTRPKQRPASRLAVIHSNNEFDRDALEGLRQQVRLHWMRVVAEEGYSAGRFSAAATVQALVEKQPDYVLFAGNGRDFSDLAREMHRRKVEAGLLTFAVLVGQASFDLPVDIAARTYLSYPTSLPQRENFEEFLGVMQRRGVELRSTAFQALAYAAARVFVEAAKNTTRQINRASLIDSLEQLHDLKTGVIGPVTFGPNRRVGSAGSYIVGIDPVKKHYVVASPRIVPTVRQPSGQGTGFSE